MGACSAGAYGVVSWFEQQPSTARQPSRRKLMLPSLTRQAHRGVMCMILLEVADLNSSLVYLSVRLVHTISTSIFINHGYS